jgi:hypothetical protein
MGMLLSEDVRTNEFSGNDDQIVIEKDRNRVVTSFEGAPSKSSDLEITTPKSLG